MEMEQHEVDKEPLHAALTDGLDAVAHAVSGEGGTLGESVYEGLKLVADAIEAIPRADVEPLAEALVAGVTVGLSSIAEALKETAVAIANHGK